MRDRRWRRCRCKKSGGRATKSRFGLCRCMCARCWCGFARTNRSTAAGKPNPELAKVLDCRTCCASLACSQNADVQVLLSVYNPGEDPFRQNNAIWLRIRPCLSDSKFFKLCDCASVSSQTTNALSGLRSPFSSELRAICHQ